MKISKIIFSELLLFMLVFNSGAFNGPAVPVEPDPTPSTPSTPSTPISIELKEGANVVNENSYVYINATPQMPQLTALLKPTGLSGDAKWRLHIEYKRNPRNDDEYYPGPTASSWKTLSAGATWNIASEFGTDFRGGKATLYCEYQGVEFEQVFHIRGISPYEYAVEDEIGATPWYAIPIAKWESDRPSQGIYYAQFNEIGVFGPNPDNYMACPNFGGPNGWGIMQLDPPPSDETLWNWKQNIADGKVRLDAFYAEAYRWMNDEYNNGRTGLPGQRVQARLSSVNGVGQDVPINDLTYGNITFSDDPSSIYTFEQAIAISSYNGTLCPDGHSHFFVSWQGTEWAINPNINDYVNQVCQLVGE